MFSRAGFAGVEQIKPMSDIQSFTPKQTSNVKQATLMINVPFLIPTIKMFLDALASLVLLIAH